LRRFAFLLLLTVAAPAQEGTQLPSLAETAAKASAAWANLAKGVEGRIARMLPCDPRLTAAIEEVSQASEARLAAVNQYVQAAVLESQQDSETARAALTVEQASARELETDRAEIEQERIAVEGQLSDLTDSAKRRPALEDARVKLQQIASSLDARGADLQAQIAKRATLVASLGAVLSARQARQRALEAQLSALPVETQRWNDYYAARLARARTECEITNPSHARRKQ
jgi:chromosome segregation ATPase